MSTFMLFDAAEKEKDATLLFFLLPSPPNLDADSPHDRLLSRFHVIGIPEAALQFARRSGREKPSRNATKQSGSR
jgi:hypothetical protein